jgi:hypothetical protein
VSLTFDQRTHLTAARYGHLFENASGRPCIQPTNTTGNVLRVNARIAVVEQLRSYGWIVLDANSRYQLTDAGRDVWEAVAP